MNTITHTQRYLPHEINTRPYAVLLYSTGIDVSLVTRKYHISKSSLMRWNRKPDGTKASLMNKSHRPHSQHPNAHTPKELKWTRDYHRRNPHISIFLLPGTKRFGELKKSIGNVSQKVLTAQLRAMEESGLLTRTVYPEVPPRVEYTLTELGQSLKPILDAMRDWGEEYKETYNE